MLESSLWCVAKFIGQTIRKRREMPKKEKRVFLKTWDWMEAIQIEFSFEYDEDSEPNDDEEILVTMFAKTNKTRTASLISREITYAQLKEIEAAEEIYDWKDLDVVKAFMGLLTTSLASMLGRAP